MNMLELIEISNDELLEIDGGGWLSRIGGVLRLYNIRRWIGAGWCRCCKWSNDFNNRVVKL